jgi:hypothetical protein
MNQKPNTRKIFEIAMADMNDELSLVWKPVKDFIIDNTLNDLAVKFSKNWLEHDRVICSNFDWQQPVSRTYLDTKEQRKLNKELGLTKTETINKFYKS